MCRALQASESEARSSRIHRRHNNQKADPTSGPTCSFRCPSDVSPPQTQHGTTASVKLTRTLHGGSSLLPTAEHVATRRGRSHLAKYSFHRVPKDGLFSSHWWRRGGRTGRGIHMIREGHPSERDHKAWGGLFLTWPFTSYLRGFSSKDQDLFNSADVITRPGTDPECGVSHRWRKCFQAVSERWNSLEEPK